MWFNFTITIVNNNISGFVGIGLPVLAFLLKYWIIIKFQYNPFVHPPEMKNYKRRAVFSGFAIFLVNVILLLLPSRLLIDSILTKNNIFEKIESIFNF